MGHPIRRTQAAPWLKDALWKRAQAVPSLDLRFADNKSLVDSVSGQNPITFTRASSATFIDSTGKLQTAATDVPRFDHNPATGESLGLLIEEQRTNLLLYSEQFDNAYWGKDRTAVTPNAATAPDGTSTADLLYTTVTGAITSINRNLGAISSSAYTNTVYLKSAGSTWAYIYGPQGNQVAFFNLITGTIGTVGAGLTASMLPVGNGWYKCSVTQTVTFLTIYVGSADANGNTTSTASGTSGIFIWGAQLEQGAFPTSYIPTTTAAVTRAADVASITGANFSSWYNANAGTLLAYQRSLAGQDAYQTATFGLSSSNTGAQFIAIEATNNYNRFYVYGNGNTAINYIYAPVTPGTLTKDALAYANNDVAAVRNGGTVAIDTSVGIPMSSLDRAGLGWDITYGLQKQKTIARLTYWPARLPNPTLQRLTQ